MSHKHSITENPVQLVGIAALAAAVGAFVAMLFTPRSGDQVRRGLRRRAGNIKHSAKDHMDLSGDATSDVADSVKTRLQTTASKVADDMKSTAKKVQDDAKATKDDADSVLDEAKSRSRDG